MLAALAIYPELIIPAEIGVPLEFSVSVEIYLHPLVVVTRLRFQFQVSSWYLNPGVTLVFGGTRVPV
jgi:hypothetical protein